MASVDSMVYSGKECNRGGGGGEDGEGAPDLYGESELDKMSPVSVYSSFADDDQGSSEQKTDSDGSVPDSGCQNFVRAHSTLPYRFAAQPAEQPGVVGQRQLKNSIFEGELRRALKEDGLHTSCCPEYVLELARKYQIALNDQNKQLRTEGLAQDRDSDLVSLSPRSEENVKGKDLDPRSRPICFGQQRHLAEEIFREMNAQDTKTKVKKGTPSIVRSPSGIKNAILRWCQMKTKNYPPLGVTPTSYIDGDSAVAGAALTSRKVL
ncbi:unnamed protein product [Soboliphyme baturini]|uniref:U-box domain-containing protein n=1 Tax=Soboliphyme baturini TaxID=241478 RepID=A0A183IIX5_9BILA|nr:unnamed protein product [Soboliphyme baturini]